MTKPAKMGGPMLGADVDPDPAGLDPGIRRTVAWVRSLGLKTSDSGDGRTKFEQGFTEDDGVIPYPHVAIPSTRRTLCRDADRLADALYGTHDIEIDDAAERGPRIDASYSPCTGRAMILLVGVDDSMLKPQPT